MNAPLQKSYNEIRKVYEINPDNMLEPPPGKQKIFFFKSTTTIYANHFLLFFRTKKLKSIKELAQKEIDEYKLAQEKIFRQKVQAKQNEIEDGFK